MHWQATSYSRGGVPGRRPFLPEPPTPHPLSYMSTAVQCNGPNGPKGSNKRWNIKKWNPPIPLINKKWSITKNHRSLLLSSSNAPPPPPIYQRPYFPGVDVVHRGRDRPRVALRHWLTAAGPCGVRTRPCAPWPDRCRFTRATSTSSRTTVTPLSCIP